MNMRIWLLFVLCTSILIAQEAISWGQEFQVSTYTRYEYMLPRISRLPNSGFVVCWGSFEDDSKFDVYCQFFASDGSPEGHAIRINTFTNDYQWKPDVCTLYDGSIVFCWESYNQDGSDSGIYAQRFSAEGQPLGQEFRVNSTTAGDQVQPNICALSQGGFVIGWTAYSESSHYDVYAQCYDANCSAMGSEFRVNSHADLHQILGSMCGLTNGDFLICWESGEQDGYQGGIFAKLYAQNGSQKGGEFLINDTTDGDQIQPNATSLSDGSYIVSWLSDPNNSGYDVFYKRFAANGDVIGREIRVNTYTVNNQLHVATTSLSDSGFVICWSSWLQDGSRYGVYAQRYDFNGKMIGHEFRVNDQLIDDQMQPDVCGLNDNSFVVCWQNSQKGSGYAIFGKKYPDAAQRHSLRKFRLLQPEYDATVSTTDPTLVWQSASQSPIIYPWELQYSIQYDTLLDFSTKSIAKVDSDTLINLFRLKSGKTWFWKVLARTYYGDSLCSDVSAFHVSHTATAIEMEKQMIPTTFELSNFPNPFNPSTAIKFELPTDGFISIKIYDLTGRLVRMLVNEQKLAGMHAVQWNGTDDAGQKVAAGVYLYQIEFTNAKGKVMVLTKKMSVVK